MFEPLCGQTDGNGSLSVEELEGAITRMLNDEPSVALVNELLEGPGGNDVMKTSIGQMSEFLAGQAVRVVDLVSVLCKLS